MEVSNVNSYKKKFKLLFEKFLNENFELSGFYSENLVGYLNYCAEQNSTTILETPFFTDLLIEALKKIDKISVSVKIFLTQVLTFAFKNELQYSKIVRLEGICYIAHKLFSKHSNVINPIELSVAGLKLSHAQLMHYTGLYFQLSNKLYAHVLLPESHRRPKKISEGVWEFMARLVWKLNEFRDEAGIQEVLEFLVKPIVCDSATLENMDEEKEALLLDRLLPYLYSLNAVLEHKDAYLKSNMVTNLLIKHFLVEVGLYYLVESIRKPEIVLLILQINFRLALTAQIELYQNDQKTISEVLNEITVLFYNQIQTLMRKRLIKTAMGLTETYIVVWSKLVSEKIIPSNFERSGKTYDVYNQFVYILNVPFVVYATKHTQGITETMEPYHLKMNTLITEHVIKVGYSVKALSEESDITQVCLDTMKSIFVLKGHLPPGPAGIIYQGLYYVLGAFVVADAAGDIIISESSQMTQSDIRLLSQTLEVIKMLLKEHDIKWYDNYEITCLQSSIMNLLKRNILPTKLIVQALDLIDICIKKFLCPDLSLLVESKAGSTLDEMGTVMKSYIQNTQWEIRDCALQLLKTCTDLSYIKYLPLRKLINKNNLVVLAGHAALGDSVMYVQATALKCLAAASKIDSMWRETSESLPFLHQQLEYLLKNNPEGIVRIEAAACLTEIYAHQKLSVDYTKHLHSVMAEAAMNDLHWEVQIAALGFWKRVIQDELSFRAIINGKFPSVTFSKEKRKIITLNQTEIRKQITSIMDHLSEVGCLTVLHNCLKEDYNLQVLETAYSIAKDFMDILDYYKYDIVYNANDMPAQEDDLDMIEVGDVKVETEFMEPERDYDMRDKIIDDIISKDTYELLYDLYDKYTEIKTEEMDEESIVEVPKTIDLIRPEQFIDNFRSTNFVNIIQQKSSWNVYSVSNNLDSLLDDILSVGEVTNQNFDDCD